MMRYRLFIILFLALWTGQGRAQQAFPLHADNPAWNVLECFWYACSTDTYQYVYDTTFCGKTWSVMPISGNSMRGYIFSDSVRTTFRISPDCMDKEYVLYDYSVGLGDTVYAGYNLVLNAPDDTLAYQLVQVDTVSYFGVNRQRFAMRFDRCNWGFPMDTVYWVRGIGSLQHPFYSFKCICDFCETRYVTLCFQESSTLWYQNQEYNTCDTTITGVKEVQDPSHEIHFRPNPFKRETEIVNTTNRIMELDIFTISGMPLKKYSGKDVIRMGEELVPGVYIARVTTGDVIAFRKLVKVSR